MAFTFVNQAILFGCWIAMTLLLIKVDVSSSQEFQCESGHCFWSFVQENSSIDFRSALKICKDNDAKPAIIRDENSFNRILQQVRANIPASQTWTAVWTGMRFNPKTQALTPESAYWRWYPVHSSERRMQIPWAFSRNVHAFKHVYLEVQLLQRSRFQGLINREQTFRTRGVVCEKML